jgi:hypothetical protein
MLQSIFSFFDYLNAQSPLSYFPNSSIFGYNVISFRAIKAFQRVLNLSPRSGSNVAEQVAIASSLSITIVIIGGSPIGFGAIAVFQMPLDSFYHACVNCIKDIVIGVKSKNFSPPSRSSTICIFGDYGRGFCEFAAFQVQLELPY